MMLIPYDFIKWKMLISGCMQPLDLTGQLSVSSILNTEQYCAHDSLGNDG